MTATTTGWVVVGTYGEGDRMVSEVMAEGFSTEAEALKYRGDMARRCPAVAFAVETAAWAAQWVTG